MCQSCDYTLRLIGHLFVIGIDNEHRIGRHVLTRTFCI